MKNGANYKWNRRDFIRTSLLALAAIPFIQSCTNSVEKLIFKITGTNHILGHRLRTSDFPKPTKTIKRENIVEVIDHHNRESWLDENPNLKIQIEPIGAAATLVTERFKNENIDISRESAILLYYGIISNTMNLKIKLTSPKDIEMANWLKSKVPEITDETTTEIFVKKSQIGESLREEMEVEFKDQFMTISWSMGQLEVANVDDFFSTY